MISVENIARQARLAARSMRRVSPEQRADALQKMAAKLVECRAEVLKANVADIVIPSEERHICSTVTSAHRETYSSFVSDSFTGESHISVNLEIIVPMPIEETTVYTTAIEIKSIFFHSL